MSLIWPASEQQIVIDEPRLHAFVIGVGDYPHLNNGSGPVATNPLGLSQVTTPRHTAPAIANWLLNVYHNSSCPLGSVEVLVSPSTHIPAVPEGALAESATMQRIEDAFAKWMKRCSAQTDNIAFLYFCGHGLEKDDAHFLLPEDFGDPGIPNQWKNCIDFSRMLRGMSTCKAQTQLFFIDACRETPLAMLSQVNVGGDPLITARVTDKVNCSAVYYATTPGRRAYGPDNGVSYFGQAVLRCLTSGVALNEGETSVYTDSLYIALGKVMSKSVCPERTLTCGVETSGRARIHEIRSGAGTAIECTFEASASSGEIYGQSPLDIFPSWSSGDESQLEDEPAYVTKVSWERFQEWCEGYSDDLPEMRRQQLLTELLTYIWDLIVPNPVQAIRFKTILSQRGNERHRLICIAEPLIKIAQPHIRP